MGTLLSNRKTKSAISPAIDIVKMSVPAQPPSSQVTPATKTVAKVQIKTIPKPEPKPQTEKPVKAKKAKLIREKFKIPKVEYTVLENLKDRASKLGYPAKKSELLLAGFRALAKLQDKAFLSALHDGPIITTGSTKTQVAK